MIHKYGTLTTIVYSLRPIDPFTIDKTKIEKNIGVGNEQPQYFDCKLCTVESI